MGIRPRGRKAPSKISIRTYRVGFGDCFLMTFHYGSSTADDRHVLIDFGSTHKAKGEVADLGSIAMEIERACGGKLHMLVATHRHKDHIAGFATTGKGNPGKVIAALEPDLVVQPWTEDPSIEVDALAPARPSGRDSRARGFVRMLADMHAVAETAGRRTKQLRLTETQDALEEISFIADDNIKNRSAVENLIRMGRRRGVKAVYAHAGMELKVAQLLPGVKVHVLGPPTLEQSDAIRKMRSGHETEYWHLQALANGPTARATGLPFPEAKPVALSRLQPEVRWLVRRLKRLQVDQLLSIVHTLDNQMNNTSLILLFEVGGKRLLFPGDAQFENWSFTLKDERMMKLLKDVDLYKVGHHGSLNATPKSLWKNFSKLAAKGSNKRLKTLLSTLPDVHGKESRQTEVPRGKLLSALRKNSDLVDTTTFETTEFVRTVELTLK